MPAPANILLIISDQLSALALSAYGKSHAATPNMDRVFESGAWLRTAFTNCPLCGPSRASFWTGRYPHRTRVLSNGREAPVTPVPPSMPTLGQSFQDAGYRTRHFGKQHDSGALRGFACAPIEEAAVTATDPSLPVNYDTARDRATTAQVVEFLDTTPSGGGTPYFAVADMCNPHNICGWVGAFQDAEVPEVDEPLPAPPENLHRPPDAFSNLPLPVRYLCCAHNRQAQIAAWDEIKIRHYLRAYAHYIERVDAEIGSILGALERRADADNTLLVLMADHGDAMGGRWMATKHCTFYEETMRVPLAFAGPGVSGRNRPVDGLVSLVDLFPTLCDYAGIRRPDGLDGRSLMPQLRGERPAAVDYVAAEWYSEWGYTIEPGRMIRSERFKYTHYLEAGGEELYDLREDPGELRNLVADPAYSGELRQHREWLTAHLEGTADPYRSLPWKADARWRSHTPGYRNHCGPTAPMAAGH